MAKTKIRAVMRQRKFSDPPYNSILLKKFLLQELKKANRHKAPQTLSDKDEISRKSSSKTSASSSDKQIVPKSSIKSSSSSSSNDKQIVLKSSIKSSSSSSSNDKRILPKSILKRRTSATSKDKQFAHLRKKVTFSPSCKDKISVLRNRYKIRKPIASPSCTFKQLACAIIFKKPNAIQSCNKEVACTTSFKIPRAITSWCNKQIACKSSFKKPSATPSRNDKQIACTSSFKKPSASPSRNDKQIACTSSFKKPSASPSRNVKQIACKSSFKKPSSRPRFNLFNRVGNKYIGIDKSRVSCSVEGDFYVMRIPIDGSQRVGEQFN